MIVNIGHYLTQKFNILIIFNYIEKGHYLTSKSSPHLFSFFNEMIINILGASIY